MSTGISDQRMKGQGNQGMFGPSFGQQSSCNYFPNNGEGYNKNSWDSQQVNGASRRGYDDYYRGNDKQRSYGNDGVKSIEHGVQGMGLDGGNQRDSYTAKANSQSNTTSAAQPKKTTWASIASQPVKSSQTRISSTLKKKPGMPSHIKVPPPPMIPGKHNMDIGMDSDKNGALVPPPVPSPPPVIDEPSPFQFPTKNHNNANNNSTNNNPEQFQAQQNRNDYRDEQRGGPINRDRDSDRGPMNRDREGGWHRRDNGYHQQNRYQPRSNYGPPNHDRQSNYQENRNYQPRPHYRASPPHNQPPHYGSSRSENSPESSHQEQPPSPPKVEVDAPKPPKTGEPPQVLEKILDKNNYNPPEMDLEGLDTARFFVIKSYSEDDIHRSIKYEIWCSTEHGNKRLDQAFRDAEAEGGKIFLLFSVNSSGHFCGVAQMTSAVDYNSVSSVWHQDKWKGKFSLKWVYVKDVPNPQLRHIRLENNENKSVTNSRDTQEVPNAKGQQVLQIIHTYKHSTSIFDDIEYYEQRQDEENIKRTDIPPPPQQQHQHDDNDDRGQPKRGGGFQRNDGGNYRNDGGGYDYRPNRNHGNYQRDQGNNRGYHNSYDNRRDDYNRGNNYDRPPPNRDYNRRDGGFMSRDRGDNNRGGERDINRGGERDINRGGERDNNRYDYRDRMERNDDHHSGGGFKRNYSNNFGNRSSNNGGAPNANSNYRN